ncbi:metallophosphatase [Rhodococcus hoagii]|nr:metallophosphatase [Prescottella equi]
MSVYFTSDVHLGHEKIAEHRGYASVKDHDKAIMHQIVGLPRGSQLWVLGDLTIGRRRDEDRWLHELGVAANVRGLTLHLVPGNHDSCHPMHRDSHKHQRRFVEVFESVQPFARRKIGGHDVLLSHFPYVGDHTEEDRATQYRLRDEGKWLLHGHTHQSQPLTSPGVRHLHVGWDTWHRPVSLNEIAALIDEEEDGR